MSFGKIYHTNEKCISIFQSSPKSGCTSSAASNSGSSQASNADLKAQKIKEALEKMKEAKMKKIYVKIFLEDGNVKKLLIDERWTVLETMKQLAEKLNITLTPEHSIVEEYPDLHISKSPLLILRVK